MRLDAATWSNFTVTPTEVNLGVGDQRARHATQCQQIAAAIRGHGRQLVRRRAWQDDADPSSDVTFFPKLVELAGGASRNIRVGINAGMARDVEQSFRLFIEELPDQSAPKANEVALRTKVGIPVFVRPVKPVRSAAIDGVSVENGKVLARLRNTGNLHISVDTISVKGTGGSGAPTFTKEGPGWYVLPGATRIFEVPMTAAECKSTTAVAVVVFGHAKSLKGASQVSPAACGSP